MNKETPKNCRVDGKVCSLSLGGPHKVRDAATKQLSGRSRIDQGHEGLISHSGQHILAKHGSCTPGINMQALAESTGKKTEALVHSK